MSDLTGQHLGQYELLARIGKGSTSTIYKAYQSKLDRFVAVKVLSPHVVDEEGFLERFTQEARAVAQLDHPNIVPVYDFDQIDDMTFIVFKYVEGGSLRSLMTAQPIELSVAVDIATQLGLALGYAHKRGVIHRDVKPSNVLIGEGRWAMLTDFGLAKILGSGQHLTKSGVGMGTPDYISPEQAQGLPSDSRSDLYSLGVTLYEMVSGRVPFQADSSMGVVVKHITQPPPSPCEFSPNLPTPVEQVILRALEKDPDKRFQSAEAMIAALMRAAGSVSEQPVKPSPNLAAVSVTRTPKKKSQESPSTFAPVRAVAQVWRRAADARASVSQRIKANWLRLTPQGQVTVAGVIVVILTTLIAAIGLVGIHPTYSTSTPIPTLARVIAVETATPYPPTATPSPTNTPAPTYTPAPTNTPAPTSTPTPSPTSEWTYLPSSAKIQPGIYVQVVRPSGIELYKGAGFDNDWILTIPTGKLLYVMQGPVKANALSWLLLSDGVTAGWGVQDYVRPYGIKKTP